MRYEAEDNIIVKMQCEFAQDTFICEYTFQVFSRGTSANDQLIGKGRIVHIDVERANIMNRRVYEEWGEPKNHHFYEYYDALFKSCSDNELALEVYLTIDDPICNDNIVIIERLETLPQHRKKGYGEDVIACVLEYFMFSAGIAAIKSFPLQFEDGDFKESENAWRSLLRLDEYKSSEATATHTLQQHYQKLGFELIDETDIMVSGI